MRGKRRDFSPLDLTPLVDVLFMVLIFFFLATQLKDKKQAVDVALPQVKKEYLVEGAGNEISLAQVVILKNSGSFAFEGKSYKTSKLSSLLKALKRNRPVELHMDKKSRVEDFMSLYAALQKYGFEKLKVVVNSP